MELITSKALVSIAYETAKVAIRMMRRSVLEGFFLDAHDKPLEGATITASKDAMAYQDTTYRSGRFIIDKLPPGRYDISTSYQGHSFGNADKVLLEPGKVALLKIQLPMTQTPSNESVDFVLITSTGPLPQYRHEGKRYVVGVPGIPYKIRVNNYTKGKILAVIGIDGLSIMDGKPAKKSGSGYIIPAMKFIDIPGWRLNNNEVAQFIFSTPDKSYASQMSTPDNIGVIGCAFYKDKYEVYEDQPMYSRRAGPESVGTGFGERREHQVTRGDFDPEPEPFAVRTLFTLDAKMPDPFAKDPFPGCAPPPGWAG